MERERERESGSERIGEGRELGDSEWGREGGGAESEGGGRGGGG